MPDGVISRIILSRQVRPCWRLPIPPESTTTGGPCCRQISLKSLRQRGRKKANATFKELPTFSWPGRPLAFNYGLLCLIYGLLRGIVACCLGYLACQGGPSEVSDAVAISEEEYGTNMVIIRAPTVVESWLPRSSFRLDTARSRGHLDLQKYTQNNGLYPKIKRVKTIILGTVEVQVGVCEEHLARLLALFWPGVPLYRNRWLSKHHAEVQAPRVNVVSGDSRRTQ